MKSTILSFFTTAFIFLSLSCTDSSKPARKALTLSNDSLSVTFDLHGGALIDMRLTGREINPFDWYISRENMPANNRGGAPFQGHFLCSGRWGAPTPGEQQAGIPHNGEFANIQWQYNRLEKNNASMRATATKEQWTINRQITLHPHSPLMKVSEEITNLLPSARFYSIVQHATMGGEFLTEHTVVDSNADTGFNQSLITVPDREKYIYQFPTGYRDTLKTILDLRQSTTLAGYVSTHIIRDTTGWITVASPDKGVLVGYLWKKEDYPWIHIWHEVHKGKPTAKGVEFGTTGLGDTFTLEENLLFSFEGNRNLLVVDAFSRMVKEYYTFLLPVPVDFYKTTSIKMNKNIINIFYETQKGVLIQNDFNIESLIL